MMQQPVFNRRQDGSDIPERTLRILDTFEALRARALIRLQMSRQDAAEGNAWGAARNEKICDEMMNRAWTRPKIGAEWLP